MWVCAGNQESFPHATPLGIGLIACAANLTQLILMDRPDSIQFLGTAGSYGNHQIGDIVTSSRASNIENSYLENRSYTPIDNVVTIEIQNVSHGTIVNSSNYITTDSQLSQRYLGLGIELENMEFYAILWVAKQHNIPAYGIFVVTNYCDSEAHVQYQKNYPEAVATLHRISTTAQT